MKLNEIFTSIQGEGRHAGTPARFIRLSGCNLSCPFCDTDHTSQFELSPEQLAINLSEMAGQTNIIWTGGEPLLQQEEILETIDLMDGTYKHHIETNGTIPIADPARFHHIAISPKSPLVLRQSINRYTGHENVEFKIVARSVTGAMDLLRDAEVDFRQNNQITLMRITDPDETLGTMMSKDFLFMVDCMTYGFRWSPRLHKIYEVR